MHQFVLYAVREDPSASNSAYRTSSVLARSQNDFSTTSHSNTNQYLSLSSPSIQETNVKKTVPPNVNSAKLYARNGCDNATNVHPLPSQHLEKPPISYMTSTRPRVAKKEVKSVGVSSLSAVISSASLKICCTCSPAPLASITFARAA